MNIMSNFKKKYHFELAETILLHVRKILRDAVFLLFLSENDIHEITNRSIIIQKVHTR